MIDNNVSTRPGVSPPLGEVSVCVDPTNNLIRVEGRGFLAARQLAGMFVNLRRIVDDRHARGEPVRVLVDNRKILTHAVDAADQIQQDTSQLYWKDDRIAVVIESTLTRMQFRRVLDLNTHCLFPTEEAGIAWLMSDDPRTTVYS